jgi:hypothetical protein
MRFLSIHPAFLRLRVLRSFVQNASDRGPTYTKSFPQVTNGYFALGVQFTQFIFLRLIQPVVAPSALSGQAYHLIRGGRSYLVSAKINDSTLKDFECELIKAEIGGAWKDAFVPLL